MHRIKITLPDNVIPAATSAGLPTSGLPELFAAIGEGTPTALGEVSDMSPKILAAVGEAVKTAYSQAYSTVFLASIAFGGLAIIATCCSKNTDIRMNNEVAKTLRAVDGVHSDTSKSNGKEEA